MPSKNTKLYSVILMTADFLVLLAAFTAAYILRVQVDSRPLVSDIYSFDYFVMALTILPLWIIVFASLGLYSSQVYNRRLSEWGRILIGVGVGILVVIGWEYVTDKNFFPARLVALYALGISFVLVILERELMRIMRTLAFRYSIGISRVLIIGNTAATGDIAESLAATGKSGYHVVAMATPKKYVPYKKGITHYSDVETALKSIKAQRINTIIQTDLAAYDDVNEKILSAAQVNHIQYSFIPGEPEFYTGKNTIDIFLGYPMISVSQTPLIGWGAIAKRFFDLTAVILTFPIWGLMFLLVAIMQKLFNRGPLFFMDKRLGLHGEPIQVYKFRSMIPEYCGVAEEVFAKMNRPDLVEEYKKYRKVTNDPRVTWFGKFIRATSLDELAQLLNVLNGTMSLVGPRPILPPEKKFYSDRAPLLFSVKPGITGLWQVSGRSDLSFDERVNLELFYAQNWSFILDLKILFKTIRVVFFRTGAR